MSAPKIYFTNLTAWKSRALKAFAVAAGVGVAGWQFSEWWDNPIEHEGVVAIDRTTVTIGDVQIKDPFGFIKKDIPGANTEFPADNEEKRDGGSYENWYAAEYERRALNMRKAYSEFMKTKPTLIARFLFLKGGGLDAASLSSDRPATQEYRAELRRLAWEILVDFSNAKLSPLISPEDLLADCFDNYGDDLHGRCRLKFDQASAALKKLDQDSPEYKQLRMQNFATIKADYERFIRPQFSLYDQFTYLQKRLDRLGTTYGQEDSGEIQIFIGRFHQMAREAIRERQEQIRLNPDDKRGNLYRYSNIIDITPYCYNLYADSWNEPCRQMANDAHEQKALLERQLYPR